MKTQEKSLGELLKQAGKITDQQVQAALAEQKRSHEPFGKVLVRLGFVLERDILQVLEGMTALTFMTGGEHFGVETFRVREIVKYGGVRPLPLSTPDLAGMTLLRGEVLPVLSFRHILGLPDPPVPEETWFLVLDHRSIPFILWVDQVQEVFRFKMAQVEPMPVYLFGKRSDLFYCLGKISGMLYSMINPDRLVRDERILSRLSEEPHVPRL